MPGRGPGWGFDWGKSGWLLPLQYQHLPKIRPQRCAVPGSTRDLMRTVEVPGQARDGADGRGGGRW